MSISLPQFKVESTDISTSGGKIPQTSGNNYISQSQTALLSGLIEQVTIPGTPGAINRESLSGICHLGIAAVHITKNALRLSSEEAVYIPDMIRIKKIGGTCAYLNTIFYAFSASSSVESLSWKVLIANSNSISNGNYYDIFLPDSTLFPGDNLYLFLGIRPNGWTSRTIVSGLTCTIPGNNYFIINPSYSLTDVGESHTINTSGFNSNYNIRTRCTITFEDLGFTLPECDRDYNDIILSVSSAMIDENRIGDTSYS